MIKKNDVMELFNARVYLAETKKAAEIITLKHADVFTAVEDGVARLKVAEAVLRDQALDEYGVTADKKLSYGFGIRVSSVLSYEVPRAFDFAKEKDMFLTLDRKAFEAAAVVLKLDWVDVVPKFTATIPKEIKFDE